MDYILSGVTVLLLALSLILVTATLRKILARLNDMEDKYSEMWVKVRFLEADFDTERELRGKAFDEADAKRKATDAKIEALEKKVDEIPVDQLQTIYDAEKQFQDGLSAIMNYGLENVGLNKEQIKNG